MLRKLQLDFLQSIKQKDTPHELPIVSKPGFKARELLEIYRESSQQGVINGLKSIYSVCLVIIGWQLFEEVAEKYIAQEPSFSPNMNDYGDKFPIFLRNCRQIKKWPYLSEMAELEWMCHQVSRAPLLMPELDFNLLAQGLENDSDISFELLPSVTTLCTSYPLYQLWQINQPAFIGSKRFIFSGKKREHLIIFRNNTDLALYNVGADLWAVVNQMENGKKLKDITEDLYHNGIELDLAAILPTILRENWILRFQII